jgi:hypothetical protein
MLLGAELVGRCGLYLIDSSWLHAWLSAARAEGCGDAADAGALGLRLYCSWLRHGEARAAVADAFARHFGAGVAAAAELGAVAAAGSRTPFAVTPRVLRAWRLAALALRHGEPLLLVGRDGCGKSAALVALAGILGEPAMQQINVTTDTEPADLVGQQQPSAEGRGRLVAWAHGPVARAFEGGGCVLLDGLQNADGERAAGDMSG